MDRHIIRYPIGEFFKYSLLVSDVPEFMNKLERKAYKIDKNRSQNIFLDKLNKLSEENFDKISLEIQEIDVNNEKMMVELVNTIFNKAITEKMYIHVYVKLCLSMIKFYIIDKYENKNIYFKEKLLNTVQLAFSNILKENDKSGVYVMIFIGELYNIGILNDKIIITCLNSLINKCLYELLGKSFIVVKKSLKKNNKEVYNNIKNKIKGIINNENIELNDSIFLKNSLD